jgi:methylmalonyl-CoA carboxyltransferase large subunit
VDVKDVVQAVSDRQQAAERQLSELVTAFKALEAKVTALSQSSVLPPAAATTVKPVAAAPAQPQVAAGKAGEVTPEVLVILVAAVTAYLGKKVRIRSAKQLQSPYEIVNPWSQQGRVVVQASHNLRSRG